MLLRRSIRGFATKASAQGYKVGENTYATLGLVHDYDTLIDSTMKVPMSFDDPKHAFSSRSTMELIRAAAIFKLCQYPMLVKNSSTLIQSSYAILGDRVTSGVLKKTFYGHFCGGEDADSIQFGIEKLKSNGIGAILDYAAEADVEHPRDLNGISQAQITARTYDYENEAECDLNAEIALQSIQDASSDGFSAIKLTAMGKPELLMHMSNILVDARRMFMALEGPTLTREKKSYLDKIVDYKTLRAGVLNSGVKLTEEELIELFNAIDQEKDGMIDYMDWLSFLDSKDLSMGPFTQFFKVEPLDAHQKTQLSNMIHRLEKLASVAAEKGVRLMIDAEQTYMQPAIDHLVLNLQRKYNKDKPIIFNTFQCYLKDSADRVHIDLERAKRENFHFASKLVRGAYMVQERKRARDMGYPDPIHNNVQDTHDNYDAMVELLLNNNHMSSFMVASHNEDSVQRTLTAMERRGISKEKGGVFFGQLLGMCDHVSYTLGHEGYSVFKYVPYGPVKEVVPYLVRRAEENSDIMHGVMKEVGMLHKEIRRRVLRI